MPRRESAEATLILENGAEHAVMVTFEPTGEGATFVFMDRPHLH